MEEQKVTKEAKEEKQIDVEKEMVYFENGEEGEDIQEESEEIEEYEEEEKEQDDIQEEAIPINEEELMTKRTYNEMILSNLELREINLENENAIKIIRRQKYKMICVNDSKPDYDFSKAKKEIVS